MKRKGFNPEHLNTFAKAHAKINVIEEYVRNLIESIQFLGIVDYKISKHHDHHLFQDQLKHPLRYHEEHPKANQLLLMSLESG